jgi:hypothetical protein
MRMWICLFGPQRLGQAWQPVPPWGLQVRAQRVEWSRLVLALRRLPMGIFERSTVFRSECVAS